MTTSDFPPKVPCPVGECDYGDTCGRGQEPCGGCCDCAGACHLEYDVLSAYTPETPQQAAWKAQWEKAVSR